MTTVASRPFDRLAHDSAVALAAGLTDAQVGWLEQSLRDIVLPSVWNYERDFHPQTEELEAIVAALAQRPPEERWAELVTSHYLSLLAPISYAAVVLVEAAKRDGHEPWLSVEADGVLAQLEALAEEIEEHSPATAVALDELLEATVLACEFVRNGRELW